LRHDRHDAREFSGNSEIRSSLFSRAGNQLNCQVRIQSEFNQFQRVLKLRALIARHLLLTQRWKTLPRQPHRIRVGFAHWWGAMDFDSAFETLTGFRPLHSRLTTIDFEVEVHHAR
jgi:hypothetical protein